jgi:hypothetical protein
VTKFRKELWKMTGDKGDAWKEACLAVEQHGHDYNLQIEAVRGLGYHSDIGIDDIVVKTESCSCQQCKYFFV